MFRLFFTRRWWWTTLIVIAGIAVSIRLGIWQLDRNAQRQATIRQVQAVQEMPILDLNQIPLPENLQEMEFRQVRASGKYDFSHQVALRNQVRARMSGTDPGIALVTPLLLSNGESVLVERGWIPLEYNDPLSWGQFDEPGMVQVQGIIRLSMEKGEMGSALVDPTLAPGQLQLDFWNFMNIPRMQQQIPYPILDIYIQQAPESDLESLPYRLMEQPDLDPGTHMGWAMQWFFYAGLLFFGYPIWLKKQKTG